MNKTDKVFYSHIVTIIVHIIMALLILYVYHTEDNYTILAWVGYILLFLSIGSMVPVFMIKNSTKKLCKSMCPFSY